MEDVVPIGVQMHLSLSYMLSWQKQLSIHMLLYTIRCDVIKVISDFDPEDCFFHSSHMHAVSVGDNRVPAMQVIAYIAI